MSSVPATILLLIAISSTWSLTAVLARDCIQAGSSPLVTFYFSTSGLVLLQLPAAFKRWRQQERAVEYSKLAPQLPATPTPSAPTHPQLLLFTLLYTGTNLCYIFALQYLTASLATTIFALTPAWVYVFSLVTFKEEVDRGKLGACALGVAGSVVAVLGAHEDGVSGSVVGVMAILAASVCAAAYKVAFNYCFSPSSPEFVAEVLSRVGAINALTVWIAIVATGDVWVDATTLLPQLGHALAAITFNFLINFGVGQCHPVTISLGTLLGIPITTVYDCARGECTLANGYSATGCAMIGKRAGASWADERFSDVLMIVRRPFRSHTCLDVHWPNARVPCSGMFCHHCDAGAT